MIVAAFKLLLLICVANVNVAAVRIIEAQHAALCELLCDVRLAAPIALDILCTHNMQLGNGFDAMALVAERNTGGNAARNRDCTGAALALVGPIS